MDFFFVFLGQKNFFDMKEPPFSENHFGSYGNAGGYHLEIFATPHLHFPLCEW